MKEAMLRCFKRKYLSQYTFFVVLLFYVLLRDSRDPVRITRHEWIGYSLLLFSGFLPFVFNLFKELPNVQLTESGVCQRYGNKVLSSVQYQDIGAIVLTKSLDRHGRREINDNGMVQCLVSLRSWDSKILDIVKYEYLDPWPNCDAHTLGTFNLHPAYIRKVVEHTHCGIYITQDMMKQEKMTLYYITRYYSDRILVCCKCDGEKRFYTYDEYLKRLA